MTIQGLDDVKVFIENEAQAIVDTFIWRLNELGMRCVAYVRDRTKEESWEDQTGNLRSSIGYVIFHDGTPIQEGGFEKVNGPKVSSTGEDGHSEGLNFARSLADKFPSGFALVVVAGMSYASIVEGMDNKDVLASGEQFLKNALNDLVEEFNSHYNV